MFLIFKIVLGPMSGTELLQHSNLNCTVQWNMIASGLPNFMKIVIWNFFNFAFKMSFDIYIFFYINSIRAHVGPRAFASLQIELYRVVEYDSKWSTKCHKDCMLEIFVIPLLRRLLIFFNFQNSIRAHVGHRAFATLQIELYPVVEYDSKWSTKFHKYCMWEFF